MPTPHDLAVLDLLERTLSRISTALTWTQVAWAVDEKGTFVAPTSPLAVAWCLLGALYKEDNKDVRLGFSALSEVGKSAYYALTSLADYPLGPGSFNDLATTRHGDVIEYVSAAIDSYYRRM